MFRLSSGENPFMIGGCHVGERSSVFCCVTNYSKTQWHDPAVNCFVHKQRVWAGLARTSLLFKCQLGCVKWSRRIHFQRGSLTGLASGCWLLPWGSARGLSSSDMGLPLGLPRASSQCGSWVLRRIVLRETGRGNCQFVEAQAQRLSWHHSVLFYWSSSHRVCSDASGGDVDLSVM